MRLFSELTERFTIPGVMSHLAVVLGLIGTILLIDLQAKTVKDDATQMEARSCSR